MTVWLNFYTFTGLVLVLDLLLGEPPNAWHPVAWFGRAATGVEKLCRKLFGNGIFSGDEGAFDDPEESPFCGRQGQNREIADAVDAGHKQGIERGWNGIFPVGETDAQIADDGIGGQEIGKILRGQTGKFFR